MVKLFDIDRGMVVMNPQSIWIPEFRKIWDRDKSKDKAKASMEISYIVFLHSFDSPYEAYPLHERETRIKRDYLKDEKWAPDAVIKDAIVRYKEFQDSTALRLLKTSRMALEAIELHTQMIYDKARNGEVDAGEIDKLIKNTKELGNVMRSLDELEKQVQKQQLEKNTAKAGRTIGLFED